MLNKRPFYALACLSVLAACTPPALDNLKNIGKNSDPTRFYTLAVDDSPLPEGTQTMPSLTLGVGPVAVTDYLDRSQIVMRASATELELGEFDRWAGSPAKEFQRVLGANLAHQLGTERVVHYPWKSSIAPDMAVEVTLERFEHGGDGKVWLVAAWQVFSDNGREAVAFRRSTLSRDSGREYNAISASLSVLSADLAQEIAAAIRAGQYRRPVR